MMEVAMISLIWLLTFLPPLVAVWRFVFISKRAFRSVLFPKSALLGVSLAIGLCGYLLLLAALVGFWGLSAIAALFMRSEATSIFVPISFASTLFLLVWPVSEALIYIGCRAKRANITATA